MQASPSNRIRRGKASRLALALLAAAGLAMMASPGAANAQAVGIACTSSVGPNPTFTLDATEGYIQLPDGNTMYMWGYALGGAAFQHPGPVLCVNEGDTVTVVLRNNLPDFVQPQVPNGVSIMFPGQVGVTANGAPVQPQFDGAGKLVSLTTGAPTGVGTSVTYSFVASKPGSYIYESGTEPQKQVRMGLFGALIVRPAAGANQLYPSATAVNSNEFTPSEEFMVLLSEIDPYQHQAEEFATGFNLNNYHPRYWLINGRGFPDSIADNHSSFLPDQPYGALARIRPYDNRQSIGGVANPAYHPLPGAIRYLNVGSEEFPYHPHGNNGRVVGRDGRPLAGTTGQDLSMEKFAINIGPGQTWDVLFDWRDAEGYSPSNPIPVPIPQVNNQEFGLFYSGSPYLGLTGPLPPGATTLNECGAYYIISHNHALFQMSSWGVNATGPITYVRVDPPKPACL